jgi:hypothetical protein
MPKSGGPKENHRSTNRSTIRFDTSIPPVILTSEVRKEIWVYLRFVLPLPSLRITKYHEWPARYEKKSHCSTYPLPICLTQQIISYAMKANRKSLHAITACNITPNNMAPPMALPYPQSVWFASLLDRIPEMIILAQVHVPVSKFQCRHRTQCPPILLSYRRTIMSALTLNLLCVYMCCKL